MFWCRDFLSRQEKLRREYKKWIIFPQSRYLNSNPDNFLKFQGTPSLTKIEMLDPRWVASYIKDGIPFIRRTDLEVNELECIWLEITFPNTKSFLISVWYQPQSTSKFLTTNCNELLRNSLIKVSSENKETVLTGDFNINYQKVDDNGELKSIFTLFQLKQIIKTAARVSDKTESLIDLVLTNVPFNITMNDVYALSFSCHDLIGFNSKQNRVKNAPKTILCSNYRRYDNSKLKDVLKMLIGHQCTSHIPFRIHYKCLIEYWLSFLIDTPRLLQKRQTLIYLYGWL